MRFSNASSRVAAFLDIISPRHYAKCFLIRRDSSQCRSERSNLTIDAEPKRTDFARAWPLRMAGWF